MTIVGLFPGISDTVGGISVSGRTATVALKDFAQSKSAGIRILSFDPSDTPKSPPVPEVRISRSKADMIVRTAWLSGKPTLVLVWHIGLLKLLPFIKGKDATVVLFLHGIEAWNHHGPKTQRLLSQVDCFFANSKHTWRRFLSFAPTAKDRPYKVVELGVSFSTTEHSNAKRLPATLMLGRAVRKEDYKGHKEVIHAWSKVVSRSPNSRLWIAGDGDLIPDLKTLARRHGIDKSVDFFGRIDEKEKHRLISHARCLAMPSRNEGFGLVYLEAMRMGLPCLVSDCDAGREVVNPPAAGLAVDPADPAALVDSLCRLMKPGPEWDHWSAGARHLYESQFTEQHFRERLLTALKEIQP